MIRAFVTRPAMTLMFVSVFVVLGIVSYFNLLIEQTPKVEFPIVTVKTIYPGAAPLEIETQIVKKIEDAVSEISEIKNLQSYAYESFCFIFIEFKVGVDVNVKSIEVKDKVEAIQNTLPDGAEKPIIAKFDPLIKPVLELILTSNKHDDRELFEHADKKLKSRLSTAEGVATVEIYGGKQRQINVRLDRTLMKKHYIAIGDVISAISSKNLNMPGGSIDKTDQKINVRLVGEFSSVQEIADMKIVSKEGNILTLSQIATIEDSHKKVETIAKYNAQNAVGLSVKKLSDGNGVKIAKSITKLAGKLKKELPDGMDLIIAFDSTKFVLKETRDTLINIAFGIILTVIILFLFTGDLRVTFIASVVIPTSIVSSFFLMDYSNFTINFLTLLAIATSLGTLIANAIVIIESVITQLEKGQDPVNAAINGTRNVTIAVLAAAGTNLVVFTPISFMGGIVGQFMKQFGLTVVYATIFSIIASFSLTPMLCALILKPKSEKRNNGNSIFQMPVKLANRGLGFLVKEYLIIFNLIMKYSKTSLLLLIPVIGLTVYAVRYVGFEFFSQMDEDRIAVDIKLPQGTALTRTQAVIEELEKLIQEVPEATSAISSIGKDGAEQASMIVNLVPAKKRNRSDLDIINALMVHTAKIPETEINLTRGGMGPDMGGDVSIHLRGTDYKTMIALSKKMIAIMDESGYFRSITSSYKNPKTEIRFVPDEARMIRFNVKNMDVATALRSSITGNDSNVYKELGEEYKINIELDEVYKGTPEDIGQIGIFTNEGLLSISNLGEVSYNQSMPNLRRRDKSRIIQLDGYLSKSTMGEVQQVLNKKFKELDFPSGYDYRYVGTAEMFEESAIEIGKAFLLAVILTYMLLVAILNSFTHPFTIVTSIATSFVGVVLFLFYLDFTVNIGSMMAIVMLVGLVVNSAILLIDHTMNKMKSGASIKDGLWLGASEKFRAIIMTSIAIVFGALPQIFDPNVTKASMGGVIVGGVLASIVFTFLLIPIIFSYLERLKNFMVRIVT